MRVFVGFDSADTPEQRVGLAMAELRRTGAFDRAHLLIQAPAGSGYANSFPVDILEVLTRGDCAAVAVGYGLLPSFLSMGKVDVASHTQRLLLDAIRAELSRARPPAAPAAVRREPRGEGAGGRGVGRARSTSTTTASPPPCGSARPAASRRTSSTRCARGSRTRSTVPSSCPSRCPAPRPRVWFLEHDGDPVVRFRPKLLLNRPAWLPVDGTRGRNIPEAMSWKPGITFAQAFVDTMFATNVKPGLFESRGHDYRADLGAVTTAAFDLPSDAGTAERLEAYLRRKEIERAERIGEEQPRTPCAHAAAPPCRTASCGRIRAAQHPHNWPTRGRQRDKSGADVIRPLPTP